jgi:hypothetical protein
VNRVEKVVECKSKAKLGKEVRFGLLNLEVALDVGLLVSLDSREVELVYVFELLLGRLLKLWGRVVRRGALVGLQNHFLAWLGSLHRSV